MCLKFNGYLNKNEEILLNKANFTKSDVPEKRVDHLNEVLVSSTFYQWNRQLTAPVSSGADRRRRPLLAKTRPFILVDGRRRSLAQALQVRGQHCFSALKHSYRPKGPGFMLPRPMQGPPNQQGAPEGNRKASAATAPGSVIT